MDTDRVCVICDGKVGRYAHNAAPVRDGECCDDCNYYVVLPERNEEAALQWHYSSIAELYI